MKIGYRDWFIHKLNKAAEEVFIHIETLGLKERLQDTFPNLVFNEEAHKYYVEGTQMLSVSGTISKFYKHFDAEKVAAELGAIRNYWDNSITKETLLEEWDETRIEACDKGHRVHLFGENFPVDEVTPVDLFEEAVINFWKSLPPHIVPVGFELQMYCKKLGLAGTSDILLYNLKTEKFIIADYKTNKDLFKNFMGQKMFAPFNHLLDCPISKYTLQLSFYQYLFELTGFEVERRIIIWLKPDSTFQMYDTEDVRELILSTYNNES